MGYSRDLFTNPEIDEEFICLICHDVLKEVKLLKPCEHAFCSSCIQEMRTTTKSNTCPYCRRDITDTMVPPRMIVNLLNKLELKCPFTANGCGTVLKLGALPDHDLKCKFNPENQRECERGCGAVVTQFERKSGAHSCVKYLKEQWQVTKDELKTTRARLRNTWGRLLDSKVKLRHTQNDLHKVNREKTKLAMENLEITNQNVNLRLLAWAQKNGLELESPEEDIKKVRNSLEGKDGKQASRATQWQWQWGNNGKGGGGGGGGRAVPKERYFKKEKKWNGR